ncbi:MAG: L,D-transpeptidase [Anaerolineales bacterium]
MPFSRREFLKFSSLSLAALALRRVPRAFAAAGNLLGRVSYDSVSVLDAPRLDANRIARDRFRDDVLDLLYSLTPLTGPAYNPLWYRISDGYVHSAFIQPVDVQYNAPLESLSGTGQLCKVTIPFAQPFNYSSQDGWQPEDQFRLYYESNHWVTDIVEGPDGEAWYEITESWEGIQYFAKATELQAIPDEELEPISANVPSSEKRIEISLALQQLTAYEGDLIVLRTPISSGLSSSSGSGLPTETPTGRFNIFSKLPSKYMGDNRLTDDLGDRYLPGVPWTAFFAEGGYAIHGAYWHNNFGAPMSRGCVNVRPSVAQWLFCWATPSVAPGEQEARGQGTQVIID